MNGERRENQRQGAETKSSGEYYEVVGINKYQDREGQEKREFLRCGVAFPRKGTEGFVLRLSAHSISGEYLLSRPLSRSSEGSSSSAGDEIPF